ncbi:hypothetical protein COCNU_06G020600 [Cocos nucifera]|uniref:Cationic amino acid transporter C-terminal domain-containing protein n=1 Tax=Cocos nucifera TaxID=13894 RepID=A0A8K0N410_COCNU|nr:hypothetical protein COCNU_06G020600 [Cocos nucifera]
MLRDLSWWDLMWFGVGGIVGAGIFVLTGLEARTDAGPAVFLSYAISGLAAMLSVFCYTEFAVEIPVAGGSFAYLRVELGDFVAFKAAGNIPFEYIVSEAAVARSWSSCLATLFNQKPDFFRIVAPRLAEDYNHLDPMAVLVIIAVSALAVVGTKSSSRFNSIATLFHLLVIAFIVIAGFSQADAANFRPFAPFGAPGLFKASAVLFFAYVGFDAISTMAEETKNPGRDIPIGLVGSMSITTLIYRLLALTLPLVQQHTQIDVHAPFSVSFQAVGLGWAKHIVALGALKGMTTVLLGAAVGQVHCPDPYGATLAGRSERQEWHPHQRHHRPGLRHRHLCLLHQAQHPRQPPLHLHSGLAAMLSVFCYTEFAVEIPVAGGSFAYLRVELGDFVAFKAAGNIPFEYIVSEAAVARSWSSCLATLFNQKPDFFRIVAPRLAEDYNHLDPMAVLVIIAVSALAVVGTKSSSRFNSIATLFHLLVIAFIVIAGFSQADAANFRPFAPFGAPGLFKASAVLFFAYVGFDAISTMAEETKNPGRDIPIGLVGSMSITTLIYRLLALTLPLVQQHTQIDVHAPFSVSFQAWARYIARTHMVPPWLAEVNAKSGTPINATIVLGSATAIFAFFTKLSILANLLSISTLFIFSFVALAVLVRRCYMSGETSDSERNKLVGFLAMIIVSSAVTAVYWGISQGGWTMYALTVPVWFAATMGMKLFVKEARKPRLWGVPLVPWLPSASIAANVLSPAGLDRRAVIHKIWDMDN